MNDKQPLHYVGLDIGTNTVRCVIGTVDESNPEPYINIAGFGAAKNTGMRKGLITHLDEVAHAVETAIMSAERMSGIRVAHATVNINGSNVASLDSKGVVAISSGNREITLSDKLRAEEAATIVQIPSNREILQVFPKNYRVDGQDSIKDPVGMKGIRLEVDAHIVTAATPNVKSHESLFSRVGIRPAHYTVSGLAAAEAVLNRQQREAGALVIDIGAGTTNLAIIEDGEVQDIAVIPMGGNNITNDLAIGLKTDLEIAERVKVDYARLSDAVRPGQVGLDYEGRTHIFDAEEVSMIVEARVEEILEYVEKELQRVERAGKLPGGVVLVGGTANIPGIEIFTKKYLGLSSKIGKLQDTRGIVDQIQGIDFVTAIGLMNLDMLFGSQSQEAYGPTKSFMPIDVIDYVQNLLKKIKK
jgi:cell division protein FtsA